MLGKITWRADVEEGSELSIDDVKVLADAINILAIEHNKLVDIINQLLENNSSSNIGALSGILGTMTGGFGKISPENLSDISNDLNNITDKKEASKSIDSEEKH